MFFSFRFLAMAAPFLEEYNSEDASIGENRSISFSFVDMDEYEFVYVLHKENGFIVIRTSPPSLAAFIS
jgi:hypothetical protein